MRSSIGAKILAVLVLIAIAWAVFDVRQESARVRQLGSLPDCRLAAEYLAWRLAFEDSHPAELTGSDAEEFIDESEVYERAVQLAQVRSQSVLLQELESLTTVDSARWIREGGDTDPFVEVMLSKCPDEVEGLIGAKR